jgi:hypothetical protein
VRLLRERDLDAATVYETLRESLAAQLGADRQAAVAAAMSSLDFDGVLAVLTDAFKENP